MDSSQANRRMGGDDKALGLLAIDATGDAEEERNVWSAIREMPAWAVSLGVHLLILFILGSLSQVISPENSDDTISSAIEEIDEDEYKFDVTVTDQVGNAGDTLEMNAPRLVATTVGPKPQEEIDKKLEEEILKVDVPRSVSVPEPHQADLAKAFDLVGDANVDAGGVKGSIDRMTHEIRNSLRDRKTLVVWLFDESGSMKERRNAVAERFENIYKQLGMIEPGADKALKTAVVGFSDKVTFYTPDPVDDYREAAEKVRSIKASSSPKENVFTAVEQVTKKWLSFRTRMRRNMMIVIVTDERGDDYEKLEDVIFKTSKYGIRCYCIGNAAVFGREKGYIRWTYEDGFQQWLPVDQGPETVAPERLDLPFWGLVRSGDLNNLSAGYGPYALTRLCVETNGLYLMSGESGRHHFDSGTMRQYRPDYRPIRDYQRDLGKNMAKGALVAAARFTSDPNNRPRPPQTLFEATTDQILHTQINEAQKQPAVVDARLQEIHNALAMGEKDRAKLKEPRWRASYDLAMGRVLAMRVRAFGYNVVLAQMKSAPRTFEDKDNNMWYLVPSRGLKEATPPIKKMAKKATEYLTRVIDDHPGTPWAVIAEREISSAMGWTWKEGKGNFANTGSNGPDPDTMILFEEDPKTGKKRKVVKKRQPPPQ